MPVGWDCMQKYPPLSITPTLIGVSHVMNVGVDGVIKLSVVKDNLLLELHVQS